MPLATYRVQLNDAFGFAAAAAVVPYLDRLGVTDLYCSPILEAHPGSAHGYDVVDHRRLSPALGGDDAYRALSAALRAHGMGQIVDIVPNHMSIERPQANAWWDDVLQNGPASPWADYFDVDWRPVKPELRDKVLLPFLGDQYGRVLERGELVLVVREGALRLRYGERELPINPRRAPLVLRQGLDALRVRLGEEDPALRALIAILDDLEGMPAIVERAPARVAERQRMKEDARARLARLIAGSSDVAAHVEAAVAAANGRAGTPASFDALHALLEVEAYRLAYWRTAFHEINYRRFFDVNALIGLRVERPEVFAATHARILELAHGGAITGIRVDHLDGLFDPRAYLARLRGALARGGKPVYTVAEKILVSGEQLPDDWALEGTTGYDFLNDVAGLFIDRRNAGAMRRVWERFTGRRDRFDDVAYQSKRDVMDTTLASELNVLAHRLNRISEADRRSRDFTLQSLHHMLREVIAAFPAYRTYITGDGHSESDARRIESALGRARRRNPAIDPSIFDFLRDVLLDRPAPGLSDEDRARRIAFAMKLQQYTGPVQAKGVEDTAFYRHSVLLSLNEVGGAPALFGRSPADFHAANERRAGRTPHALLCTATHDTKRGEDTRARVSVLSEIPAEWSRALRRFARMHAPSAVEIDGERAPDRNEEYLLYQTLVGMWPAGGVDVGDVVARVREFMIKAVREAKLHSSWLHVDEPYERAITSFVEAVLTGERAADFRAVFEPFAQRVARLGMIGSLAQLVLKLVSPGVPDVYQGGELWDLALVDPDNRRPVDFAARTAMLETLEPLLAERRAARRAEGVAHLADGWEDGRIKLFVTACGLRLRRELPAVFRDGAYLPLETAGARAEHLVALARHDGEATVIAVVPRLVASLADAGGLLRPEAWGDTRLLLPRALGERPAIDAVAGWSYDLRAATGIAVADLLRSAPVALLRAASSNSGGT
ncbi:MAG TPA: malto-oligosyltrehalose synthase [Candidatus Binatia bacterium]